MGDSATSPGSFPAVRNPTHRRLVVWLLVGAGCVGAALMFAWTFFQERERLKSEFQAQAQEELNSFEDTLDLHRISLLALRGLYSASEEVTWKEFREFVGNLQAAGPGGRVLGWIPRVSAAERPTWEADAENELGRDLRITEIGPQGELVPAGEREEYFPVAYVEPARENEGYFGFDVASDPDRRKALGWARDAGEAVGVTQVQEIGTFQKGVRVFLPVYRGDPGGELEGFVGAFFQMEDLARDAWRPFAGAGIDARIYDDTRPDDRRLLFPLSASGDSPPGAPDDKGISGFHYAETLDVWGKKWTVAFRPSSGRFDPYRSGRPWIVLGMGLAFAAVLGLYIHFFMNRSREVERLVHERTAQLEKSEEALRGSQALLARALAFRTERSEKLLRYQSILLELAKTEYSDAATAMGRITEEASKALEVERVGVWLFNDDRSAIRCVDLYNFGTGGHESGMELQARDFPVYFQALEENRVMVAREARTDPRTREFTEPYLKPFGIVSMMDVPIRSHGRNIGLVCHEHTGEPRHWTPEEQHFGTSIAQAAALALEGGERRRAEAALARQVEELARSNLELEQFAYISSHDLQEPLRMVSNHVQMLAKRNEGKLDEESKQNIRFAVEGAGRMRRMIRDVLAYSRISRGDASMETVDCGKAFEDAMNNLEQKLEESGARVECGELPEIRGVPSQIAQLFQNLLENAVKYRREVPPEIRVEAEREDGEWRFSVADNGIGIAQEHFSKLFRIFQRLHERSKYPGNGIGLSLCKRIVEHHGGRIWVESEPGKGAVFHFTIPDPPEREEEVRHAESHHEHPVGGG